MKVKTNRGGHYERHTRWVNEQKKRTGSVKKDKKHLKKGEAWGPFCIPLTGASGLAHRNVTINKVET